MMSVHAGTPSVLTIWLVCLAYLEVRPAYSSNLGLASLVHVRDFGLLGLTGPQRVR